MILKCAWCAREKGSSSRRCIKWGVCTKCARHKINKGILPELVFKVKD